MHFNGLRRRIGIYSSQRQAACLDEPRHSQALTKLEEATTAKAAIAPTKTTPIANAAAGVTGWLA